MYKNIWSGNSYLEYYIKKHGQKFINLFAGGGGGGNKKPPRNNSNDFSDEPPFDDWWNRIIKPLKKSPVFLLRFAITLAMAAPLIVILNIINRLNGENEDKLSPDVRDIPHLTLNTNSLSGEVLYLSRIGSSFDFFETIGLDSIGQDLKSLFDGKITFGELASNIADGPVQKLINNVNPFAKAALELLSGRKLYPDFRSPTAIRDNYEYLFDSLALDWYYKALTGKPHAQASHLYNFSSSLANTQKPEEAAYWYIQAKKKEFQEKVLHVINDGYSQTITGEALYNARRAAQFDDMPLMRKYLREYYKNGGNYEGLQSSAKTIDPLNGLDETQELQFIKWLSKEDRKILNKAKRHYLRLKAKLGA